VKAGPQERPYLRRQPGRAVTHATLVGVAPRDNQWSAGHPPREPDSVSFTATATYPYVDRDRATAGLRGQLREIVAQAVAGVPDWATFVIDEPTEVEGLHGRARFVWTATVEPHRADGSPSVAPSTPSP
jgi:hypothetical protein